MRKPLQGRNSNVQRNGVVYHVQTEDLGIKRSCFITQVFLDGVVLLSKRTEYPPDMDVAVLQENMRAQHAAVVQHTQTGDLSSPVDIAPPPLPVQTAKGRRATTDADTPDLFHPVPVTPMLVRLHSTDPTPAWFDNMRKAHQQVQPVAHYATASADGMVC